MKNTFISVLSSILGVEEEEKSNNKNLERRIEALEQALILKAAEVDRMQEVVTLLVMTNPHVRVSGKQNTASSQMSAFSGSIDPDRILN